MPPLSTNGGKTAFYRGPAAIDLAGEELALLAAGHRSGQRRETGGVEPREPPHHPKLPGRDEQRLVLRDRLEHVLRERLGRVELAHLLGRLAHAAIARHRRL